MIPQFIYQMLWDKPPECGLLSTTLETIVPNSPNPNMLLSITVPHLTLSTTNPEVKRATVTILSMHKNIGVITREYLRFNHQIIHKINNLTDYTFQRRNHSSHITRGKIYFLHSFINWLLTPEHQTLTIHHHDQSSK
jgi:hypothetical protein